MRNPIEYFARENYLNIRERANIYGGAILGVLPYAASVAFVRYNILHDAPSFMGWTSAIVSCLPMSIFEIWGLGAGTFCALNLRKNRWDLEEKLQGE